MTPDVSNAAEINSFLTHAVAWVIAALIAYGARSVTKLNENIVVIIERLAGHEKDIKDHENRIREIEGQPIREEVS